MTIPITIKDAHGDGFGVKVDNEGQLNVIVHPHPPMGEQIIALPFRQYFTADGTSSGSNDMIVDGSSTPVDFWISALRDYDVYIKFITVEIGDTGSPNLNLYGTLAALSSGTSWTLFTQEQGSYVLHDGIKTNKEFVRTGGSTGAVGTGSDSYLADVSGGSGEKSYLPIIDLAQTFGLAYGVRLRKGTTDKMKFTVNDALAGLTTHNIIGYGLRI